MSDCLVIVCHARPYGDGVLRQTVWWWHPMSDPSFGGDIPCETVWWRCACQTTLWWCPTSPFSDGDPVRLVTVCMSDHPVMVFHVRTLVTVSTSDHSATATLSERWWSVCISPSRVGVHVGPFSDRVHDRPRYYISSPNCPSLILTSGDQLSRRTFPSLLHWSPSLMKSVELSAVLHVFTPAQFSLSLRVAYLQWVHWPLGHTSPLVGARTDRKDTKTVSRQIYSDSNGEEKRLHGPTKLHVLVYVLRPPITGSNWLRHKSLEETDKSTNGPFFVVLKWQSVCSIRDRL